MSETQSPFAALIWESYELHCTAGQIEAAHLSHIVPADGPERLAQFAAEWMSLFRRNCFLSGCEVECTAHEQLEWSKWLEERKSLELGRRLSMG